MSTTRKRSEIALFSGFEPAVYAELTRDLKRLELEEDASVELASTAMDFLYVVETGAVSVSPLPAAGGEETPGSCIFAAGSFFGEAGFLSAPRPKLLVTAKTPTVLLIIDQKQAYRLIFSQPAVQRNLLMILSQRYEAGSEMFVSVLGALASESRLQVFGMAVDKIGHDIRNPLTIISMLAQVIASKHPDTSQQTNGILRQLKLIEDLVREPLDFVRGSSSPLTLHKVDLDMFLRDIKESYGVALKGRDITLQVENKCLGPVYFDEERIRRVIVNLLRNCTEAMEEHGEIRVQASLSSNWLQISVSDNGPGVPESMRDELFQPFVSHGKEHGAGLGLAISRNLVKEHGGRLDFKPAEPQGSRFDIRLPQNLD